jgi:glutathione S-transferase
LILVGRNLSPYARRIAIWCALQGRAVERKALAATDPADAEAIRRYHPGTRVPALVLDDGTVLIDSFAIADWLDETGTPRLVPASGLARRDCLQRLAIAHATTEKIVALVYEKNRRPEALHWAEWQERLVGQIRGGFDAMEADAPAAGFHGGETPDGSDIAIVCALQMAEVTNRWLVEGRFPALHALADRAMHLPAFAETHPVPAA